MSHTIDPPVIHRSEHWFSRAIAQLSQVCGIAASLMILASVLITCQMIFVRFILNQSTIWQTESVIYLMVGATLIGLPYVQLRRGHVNVDLVPMMLGVQLRKYLGVFTLLLAILVIGLMLFYSFEMWHLAWDRNWKSDTVWGVRQWIPYLAMPLGFGIFLLQLTADLIDALQEDPQSTDTTHSSEVH